MPAIVRPRILKGAPPNPRGATWDGLGVNFSLFSANATKVELCLFDETAKRKSNGSNCPNTPTKSGMDICPTPGPAPSTAIACTAPTNPNRPSFQPEQAAARPVRQGACRQPGMGSAVFGYTIDAAGRPDLR